MKFVRINTKNLKFFFFALISLNLIFAKNPNTSNNQKTEAEKLREKIKPIKDKTPYEKMLNNIEFLQYDKSQKFSVAKRDIKVKNKKIQQKKSNKNSNKNPTINPKKNQQKKFPKFFIKSRPMK